MKYLLSEVYLFFAIHDNYGDRECRNQFFVIKVGRLAVSTNSLTPLQKKKLLVHEYLEVFLAIVNNIVVNNVFSVNHYNFSGKLCRM